MVVGKHAEHKKLESNILQISQDAKEMKRKHKDVIDATVGMLHHDEGNIFKFEVVEDLLHHLSDSEVYAYAPVRGPKAFTEGVFDWVFGPYASMIDEQFAHCVIPTTGGSAAVSNTFYNFNDFGQKILLPNHYWPPYKNFALEANVDLHTFLMYDEDDNFNRGAFKTEAKKLVDEQDRLTVLLNDPCNNPTGFAMTDDDWRFVIDELNTYAAKDIPVVLIHDIAYLDYQLKPTKESRGVFALYEDLHPDVLAVLVFSGSKTFSMYGFRVGAQIGVSKNPDLIDQFERVGDYSVRGRFSSVCQSAMNIIGSVFTKDIYKERFEKELQEARKLLSSRASLFLEEAKKQGLETLPYRGGFFISIETGNENIYDDLVEDHVFIIPMKGLVRIAISSLKKEDIPVLVSKLKKHL
jgi:aspartate/tyrosine/aromatic aminotransferase